jgi:hypothetical protein
MKDATVWWIVGLGIAGLVVFSMFLKPQHATVGLGAGTVGGNPVSTTINAVSGGINAISNLLSGLTSGSGGGNVVDVAPTTPVDKESVDFSALDFT